MENKKLTFQDYIDQLDDDELLSVLEVITFTTIPNLRESVANYKSVLDQYKNAHRHSDCHFVYQQLLICEDSLRDILLKFSALSGEVDKRNLSFRWAEIKDNNENGGNHEA